MTKLLYLVNVDWFFISHRLPIALKAKEAGYEVHIACNFTDHYESLSNMGFVLHPISFDRSGSGLLHELKTLQSIRRVFKRIQPDLVHAVTIKPVLYGGIAARTTGVKSMVFAVSGLGLVFVAEGAAAKFRRWLISRMYQFAINVKNSKVIFQNPVDKKVLKQAVRLPDSRCEMIRGSGADLTTYSVQPEPEAISVVMAARLLKEKGVYQFVDAARILKQRGLAVTFKLVGEPDPGNPNTVTQRELELWRNEGCVELLGFRQDVHQVFAQSNIVVLPSFYGEGLPKVLIEAAACGRAVVTTDNPGCLEAIELNQTGFAVPIKDAIALADAIERLVINSELRGQFGNAGRLLAEREFDVNSVVKKHLAIYDEVLKGASIE
ncbi:MAG: glycosyltransferase family 4 protein [Alishewanella aestuarii]